MGPVSKSILKSYGGEWKTAERFHSKLGIEAFTAGGREGVKWISRDLTHPLLDAAADLFREGQSVRQVAEALGISKSECGRIRLRLIEDGALDVSDADEVGERTANLTYSATS